MTAHDTREEAVAHHREHLLDTARYDGRITGAQHPCEVCQGWTQRFAQTRDQSHHTLCDEHCNREGLAQVIGYDSADTSVTSSY